MSLVTTDVLAITVLNCSHDTHLRMQALENPYLPLTLFSEVAELDEDTIRDSIFVLIQLVSHNHPINDRLWYFSNIYEKLLQNPGFLAKHASFRETLYKKLLEFENDIYKYTIDPPVKKRFYQIGFAFCVLYDTIHTHQQYVHANFELEQKQQQGAGAKVRCA